MQAEVPKVPAPGTAANMPSVGVKMPFISVVARHAPMPDLASWLRTASVWALNPVESPKATTISGAAWIADSNS